MVYEVSKAVSVPIIGMGGIVSAEDALEFIVAGASAVQVGTANFTDTLAMPKIIEGMNAWLDSARNRGRARTLRHAENERMRKPLRNFRRGYLQQVLPTSERRNLFLCNNR